MAAFSTCVAECIVGRPALQYAVWLRRLLENMQIKDDDPRVMFYIEKGSAITIFRHNSKTELRNKIDARHHHMVHHVLTESFQLSHTPSKENEADILMKPTTLVHFREENADLLHRGPAARAT